MSLFRSLSRHVLTLLLAAVGLSGCATQSELTAIRLDRKHPKFQSSVCQQSIAASGVHSSAKTVSLMASPALVLASGGLLLPVVAANAALDYVDRVDASNMATRCGGKGETQSQIVESVSTGAAVGVATNVLPK